MNKINIRDVANKLEEAVTDENWGEVKSALNDLWDWLDHNVLERDKVALMTDEERGKWLDDLAHNSGKR